jgi:hypothetical protein
MPPFYHGDIVRENSKDFFLERFPLRDREVDDTVVSGACLRPCLAKRIRLITKRIL